VQASAPHTQAAAVPIQKRRSPSATTPIVALSDSVRGFSVCVWVCVLLTAAATAMAQLLTLTAKSSARQHASTPACCEHVQKATMT